MGLLDYALLFVVCLLLAALQTWQWDKRHGITGRAAGGKWRHYD